MVSVVNSSLSQWIRFCLAGCVLFFSLNSCRNKECVDICEYKDSVRIDSFSFYGADTFYFGGNLGQTATFEDTFQRVIEYEVIQKEVAWSRMDTLTPCGECGDSVLVQQYIPSAYWTMMENGGGRNWKVSLRADQFVRDTFNLYKAVLGRVSDEINGWAQDFVASTVVPLDTSKQRRLFDLVNKKMRFYPKRDTVYGYPIDSASLVLFDTTSPTLYPVVELSYKGPVVGFMLQDRTFYKLKSYR